MKRLAHALRRRYGHGAAAYNRGTKVLRAQLDREAAERRRAPPRCLCGAAHVGDWTAGVHHGLHKCARVVTRFGHSNAHAVLVSRMGDGYYVGTRDPSAKGGVWLPTHAEAIRTARKEAKGRPIVDMTRYQ